MADELNRILTPYGKRSKYIPLHRELFWESEEKNLYIYNEDHWLLIGGYGKQRFTEAGDNIEILPEGSVKVKKVQTDKGTIIISNMVEGRIDIDYIPDLPMIADYPFIYISAGWDRPVRPGESVGFISAHTKMKKTDYGYTFTITNPSFKFDTYIYFGILVDDGTGERTLPEGILGDPSTWFHVRYGHMTETEVIRLKDDIDIDTMELGKFSNTLRWKGMIKLGEVYDSSFVPIVRFDPSLEELIGGKFLVKVFRGDTVEYGIYQATMSSCAWGSIFGSDNQNVKFTINREVFTGGKGAWIGFRTFNDLRNGSTYAPPDKIEIWFNGWDSRKNKEIPSDYGNNFSASKVIARN